MKKILSFGLFLISFLMLTAQITVSEGFEGSTTPTGWTYTGFVRTTATGYPCTGTAAVRKNLYGTSTNATANILYSSTGSNGKAIDVSFNYSARGYSSTTPVVTGNMKVEYSVDGGTTYSLLGSQVNFTVPVATCTQFTASIPEGTVAAGASFKFRITGNNSGSGDWYLTIDDVKLTQVTTTPPNCTTISSPANAATNVSITPAISWASVPGATSYLLNLGTTSGGTDVLNAYEVTTTSYTVATALNYNTMYYLTVVPKNANGTATGCTESTFTTTSTIACPTVTAPAAAAQGVSLTPTFTWTAVPNVIGYKLTVGTTSGGTDVLNDQDLGNVTSYTLSTVLNPSTVYYYTVNAYTSTSTSTGCAARSFTTLCSSVNIPYTQDFESVTVPALPSCTSIQHVGTTGNDWKTSSPAANGFTTKTLTYGYNATYAGNAWFYTQGINLTAGTSYRIKFRYGNNSATYIEKLKVAYGTSADFASMTNPLLDYPSVTGGVANIGFADFTPATTGVYYFGFNAYSAANQWNLYVDDIEVNLPPTCFEPTSVAATNVTSSSADVTWVAPASAPANGYQVYYSTSSTSPNGSTVLDGTNSVTSATTSATLSGLAATTKYYVWVRSACSDTDLSSWTSSVSFTTLCASVDLPYTENFESVTAPALPSCTSIQNAGTGNNWATFSLTTAGFGFPITKLLRYSYNTANAANAWFYTKGLNLTGGVKYELKFRAGSSNADYTEKMKVAYGSSPVNTAMTTVLADYPEVIHADSSVDTYYFTPATTGVYYVGFNAYSDLDQAYLMLDDISVNVAPSCTIPGVPVASNITQTSATLSWTASDANPFYGYDIYYSTSSTAPTSTTIPSFAAITELSILANGLAPGTTYYAWVRSNCSMTDKSDWTSKATFVTGCLSSVPAPYNQDFEAGNAGSLPNCTTSQNLSAGNNWTIYNNGTTTLTGNWMVCPASTTAASNAWFYTPGIYLEAGKSYKVTYKYAGAAADKLKVAYGNAANSTDMTTVLADLTCTGTANIINGSNTLSVPAGKASGVYYFGFNAYSAAGQSFVAIDNIAVVEDITLGTDTSIKDKVSVYPNPFHDVLNISDVNNVKSISISDVSGRNVRTIANPTSNVDLSNLKEGLYIVSLNMKDGSVKPIKVIKK